MIYIKMRKNNNLYNIFLQNIPEKMLIVPNIFFSYGLFDIIIEL